MIGPTLNPAVLITLVIPMNAVLSAGRNTEAIKAERIPTTFVQERRMKRRTVRYNEAGSGMIAVVTAAARLANASV